MTILIFIGILIILILVHEFGHFIAAKLFGVKVEEFGIGFPPRIASFKKGETLYSLNWLPFGGFVKIFGEQGEGMRDPRSYAARPGWQRSLILSAGVLLNIVFAFLLAWVGFSTGFPLAIGEEKIEGTIRQQSVQIVDIAKDSPAQRAGISRGDVIVNFQIPNSSSQLPIDTIEELQNLTNAHKGELVTITIKRGDELIEKELLARASPPENQGPFGITLAHIALVSYSWNEALGKAIIFTSQSLWFILTGILLVLRGLFISGEVVGEVAGPVGIAVMTGQIYNLGLPYLLSFIALISLNLAIINILPIPALDGGRLAFLGIEKLKGSPIKPETENKIHAVGFALLVSLVILVTIRDILAL